ncbi:hypothetical protein HK101_011104 [Irineochytrium annulatum]|nr:hypothetical protein HK101_011104 [Irineochytrium annulatum]
MVQQQSVLRVVVGAPLVQYPDGPRVTGNARVIEYSNYADAVAGPQPAAPVQDSSNRGGGNGVPTGLSSLVVAECVVGLVVSGLNRICAYLSTTTSLKQVLGLAIFAYTTYRSSKRRAMKKGHAAFTANNGIPVWEMGKFRIVRAEEWEAMHEQGEAMMAREDDEKKEMGSSITVHDIKSFLPSARRIDSTALAASEEDFEAQQQHQQHHQTAIERVSVDSEEGARTTIPYNYNLLSQLAGELEEDESEDTTVANSEEDGRSAAGEEGPELANVGGAALAYIHMMGSQ